jgi:16S rRNA (guanine966-N2)-methyltransferase
MMAGRQKKSQPGRLRIVAGNWRSRLLDVADVEGLRPTSERVRETLFNWLAPHIQGARCLDLFAGTGALGLEALSRGAGSVVFVEKNRVAERQLKANIDILAGAPSGPVGAEAPPANAEVVHGNALDYLRKSGTGPFDLIFLDPPFADDLLEETCRLLNERNLLADAALVYLELPRGRDEPQLPVGWRVTRKKTAGNVRYMLVSAGD